MARGRQPSAVAVGGLSAVAVVAAFLWVIHNRYYPIQEGWFSYYGELLSKGQLPYRDFYFFTQPIALWLAQAIYSVTDHVIAMRYYGFVERLVLTGVLYYILSRRFSVPASFLATVVSTLAMLSYRSEAFFTYLVTCCLFSLICLALLNDAFTHQRRTTVSVFFAGSFASLAFFSKQSNGGVITAAAFFLVFHLAVHGSKVKFLAAFVAGWWVIATPIFGWLVANGILEPYFDQVFRGAASSKGSLPILLVAFWLRLGEPVDLVIIAALLVAFAIAWRLGKLSADSSRSPNYSTATLVALVLGTLACVAIPFFLPIGLMAGFLLRSALRPLIAGMFLIALSAVIWSIHRRMRRSDNDPYFLIMTCGGFAWAYACGLSYAIEQHATVLVFALLIAASYDHLRWKGLPIRNLVTVASLGICLLVVWQKYAVAFDWLGWRESIARQGMASHWSRLAGYRTSPEIMSQFDVILDDVARYSNPGEPIFTFPFMPMFNYVTGRPQPTFAAVHYWDVCPDRIAREDADRVRRARPRLLITMDPGEEQWKLHEDAFRGGARSGQREIRKALDDLIQSGQYRLIRTWIGPCYHVPIRVFARID